MCYVSDKFKKNPQVIIKMGPPSDTILGMALLCKMDFCQRISITYSRLQVSANLLLQRLIYGIM